MQHFANDYSAQYSMQYRSATERIVTSFVFSFSITGGIALFFIRIVQREGEAKRERKRIGVRGCERVIIEMNDINDTNVFNGRRLRSWPHQ